MSLLLRKSKESAKSLLVKITSLKHLAKEKDSWNTQEH